jgi:glycosyltransferase involved in cell wall biosynthesis
MTQLVVALLGRRDEPTDAVEEYCRYLGGALRAHDIQLEIRRVPWEKVGWLEALRGLRLQASMWKDTWVVVQYTALAWSARGFPHRFSRVLKALRRAGARVAIVFHDVEPYGGTRLIDSLRRAVQIRTMRRAASMADCAIFTVRPEKLTWKLVLGARVAFVPVGPNLPIPVELPRHARGPSVPTIGIFSITGGEPGKHETLLILEAVRNVTQHVGKVRLSVFGRHAERREQDLVNGLRGLPVELSVEGVLDSSQVVERLCACDVLFFVRGGISSRRGSAIAGIACGLPLIAFSGSETAPPITDAGVILVEPGKPEELNRALVEVLSDASYRAELASRSRSAYLEHFAWPVIASRFATLLASCHNHLQ